MITFRVKINEGDQVIDLRLPEHINEIKLSQYVDFIVCMRRLTETEIEKMENPAIVLADAIHAITGVDINDLFKTVIGDLYTEDDQATDTLRAAYSWIAKVLTEYEGKHLTSDNCEFTHNDHHFVVPVIAKSPLFHKAMLPDITTGQAVSAFEMMRLSERVRNEKGDPTGNRLYTDYLYMIAYIATMDGRSLPTNPAKQTEYIEEVIQALKGVPADVAIDVDFFLNSTLAHLKEHHPIIGSLSLPLLKLAVETQSMSGILTT